MLELTTHIKKFSDKVERLVSYLNKKEKQKRIEKLDKKTQDSHFWDDSQKAGETMQELNILKEEINFWDNLQRETKELLELSELIEKKEDLDTKQEIQEKFKNLRQEFSKHELELLFQGKYDSKGAILSIHSGTGGIDAQDFSEMLYRMYSKFIENKGWTKKVLDQSKGQEAGIKSITCEVQGNYAYGYLKAEAGVHRLVRLSPFNPTHTRETSFSLVEVLPKVEDEKELEISEDEIKIDTFHSSGSGGQNVNKVETAVRITHLPTQITASCQSERHQQQNRKKALELLRSKLIQKQLEEQEKKKAILKISTKSADFGDQIRSYVLHPYKQVKDLRTNYVETNVDKVFDGNIETFIKSYLRKELK